MAWFRNTSGAGPSCVLVALAIILSPMLAGAEPVLEGPRPHPLAVGGLELGAEYAGTASKDGVVAAVGFSIGVADGVGFNAAVMTRPMGHGAAESVRGDTTLAVEYAVAGHRDDHLALLLAPSVRLPSGDATRGFGDPGVDVSLGVAARAPFGGASLSAEINHTFETRDASGEMWTVALALEYEVGRHWILEGALSLELAGDVSDIGLGVGLTWQPF